MLQSYFQEVTDKRRKQGKRYDLGNVLLLSVFAILSGATSYRKIHVFIDIHFQNLQELFSINWKKTPAYTTIRAILQGVDSTSLENVFRRYSQELPSFSESNRRVIACDGKVLRGSFDNFQDKRAAQLLSVFCTESRIILAHAEIAEKTNEIPAFQELIKKLDLCGVVFTGDAMDCQKNS